MLRSLVLIGLLMSFVPAMSQNFEGQIVYKIDCVSKIENVPNESMNTLIGTRQEYFIRNGAYKSVPNGLKLAMQQYDPKSNRLYNKTTESDTLYWFDAAANADSVTSFEVKKNAETIMGNACDALIMHTLSGNTTTVYYSPKYKMDAKAFAKHKFGNWAFMVQKTNAVPLKTVLETPQFTMTSTATEVKNMKLGDGYFTVSPQAPVKKS